MMPEEEIRNQLQEQAKRIMHIERMLVTIKRFFFWTLVITIAITLLPLAALFFAIPWLISSWGL